MSTIHARLLARRDTTENWNAFKDFIPLKGEIVIYTDRYVKDGANYPGIKIGDGNAYCIDLPFVSEYEVEELEAKLNAHIDNADIHVSDDDRTLWNKKTDFSYDNGELIIK